MPSIGDFEAAARELVSTDETSTFGWCGTTIRLVDQVGIYPLVRFSVDVDAAELDLQVLAAEHGFLKAVIHPDDWSLFEDVSLRHEVSNKLLADLVKAIITGATGRPTQRPSASPDGPPSTTQRSKDDSPARLPDGSPDQSYRMPTGFRSVDDLIEDLVSSG